MKLLPVCLAWLGVSVALAADPLDTQTPVSGFRLPTFEKNGHRAMLLQGSQAIVQPDQIKLTDLNLTLFKGDAAGTVETVILSPAAIVEPEEETAHGTGAVRVIGDNFEITGTGWTYDHRQKRVSITSHARVVFRAPLPDILK